MKTTQDWREDFDIIFKEDIYKTVPTDMDVKISKVKDFIEQSIQNAVKAERDEAMKDILRHQNKCIGDNCSLYDVVYEELLVRYKK